MRSVVMPSEESGAERYSQDEWEVRVNLAACYRLVDLFGWSDLTSTHISAAVPGEEGAFLINPYPAFFDAIRASDLVKVSLEGDILSDGESQINLAGLTIHSAVYTARPEAACVIHTHTVAGMAVSALECGLLPFTQHALLFYRSIGYHSYEGVADDLSERQSIIRDLGSFDAMIMRNHGLLALGPSVARAFKTMYYLEKSCASQLASMAAADKKSLILPSEAVCSHVADQYKNLSDFGDKEWSGHLRKLDALDPSFRA